MSMPIASIHESVDLSNRFMVYIGLIALAAGSIIMYFAGKKITSPILSLAALSERMSELDLTLVIQETPRMKLVYWEIV